MRLLVITAMIISFVSSMSGAVFGQDMESMHQELQALKDRLDTQDEEIKYLRLKVAKEELLRVAEPELEQKAEKAVQNYMETPEAKKKVAGLSPAKVKVDYGKDGFYLETMDEKFRLAVSTRQAVLYTFNNRERDINVVGSSSSPGDRDTSTFRVRRGRLIFQGHAFTKDLKYYLQFETAGTAAEGGVTLQDLYMDYYGLPEVGQYVAMEGGQFKVPFSRQFMTSSSNLQIVDRSIANEEFTLHRDVGVDFHRNLFGEKLEYHVGIFNGIGINRRIENPDTGMLYMGRIAWHPFGFFNYSESDIDYSEKLKTVLGFAVAHKKGDEIRTGPVRTAVGKKINMNIFTWDGGLKYKGFSLVGEAFLRRLREPGLSSITSSGGTTDAIGYMVQGGYFILPRHLEFATRYAYVDRDFNKSKKTVGTPVGEGTNRFTLGSDEEITVGLNYFFNGHKNKIQADATKFSNSFLRSSPASLVNDDKEAWRFRLQYQLAF